MTLLYVQGQWRECGQNHSLCSIALFHVRTLPINSSSRAVPLICRRIVSRSACGGWTTINLDRSCGRIMFWSYSCCSNLPARPDPYQTSMGNRGSRQAQNQRREHFATCCAERGCYGALPGAEALHRLQHHITTTLHALLKLIQLFSSISANSKQRITHCVCCM